MKVNEKPNNNSPSIVPIS